MTNTAFLSRAAAVLAAGGLAWLAKMAVITTTDGAVSGTGSAAASVFYLLGLGLMAGGLAGVAVALTARRPVAVRAIGALGGLVAFVVVYSVLDGIAKSLVGDAGPAWMPDEAGILTTGAVLMAAGLLTARNAQAA